MHPSEAIRGEKSNILEGKRIALCITGSIGSVEAVKLARELIRHGADVYSYMTRTALKFLGKESMLFATGHEPVVELTGRDEHLYEFDAILVAPATADIISKAACGIADDAVSTLILGNLRKCIFVPAMDMRMYTNPIFAENLEKLKKYAKFIEPRMEEGKAKMPDVERITANLMNILRHDLKGKRILVIGGAGYEKFDNFRIITNLATGKTAVDIARYAYYYGADVKLLLGLHSIPVPKYLEYESFGGIEDLISRIEEFLSYDAILVPAALPDFKPSKLVGKVKSVGEFNKIEFTENPKFLRELRNRYDGFLVGFKAESNISRDELIRRARERMKEYELDIIVANLIEDVGEDETKAIIIFSDEEIEEFSGRKEDLAQRIVEIVVDSI
jgi:phosphopantothenoylcysteine decarboxylase/phosphopantothenate--cysteine ligase